MQWFKGSVSNIKVFFFWLINHGRLTLKNLRRKLKNPQPSLESRVFSDTRIPCQFVFNGNANGLSSGPNREVNQREEVM